MSRRAVKTLRAGCGEGRSWAGWLLVLALLLLLPKLGRADGLSGPRRFALLVASTDGGRERARLRYPSKDTEALRRVLTELGGVTDGDIESLVDPDGPQVEKRLLALKQRAAQTTGSKQFFFYYSGHSDERGLLLFGSHLDYSRLRALITDIPVDVHIGILDSCAAGAFAQRKGGAQVDPFLLPETCKIKQDWESNRSPVLVGFCICLLYPPPVPASCTRLLYTSPVTRFLYLGATRFLWSRSSEAN